MRSSIKMPSARASLLLNADQIAPTAAWTLNDLGRNRHSANDGLYGDTAGHAQDAESAAALAEAEQERRLQDAYTTGYEEGRIAGELAEGMRLRNAVNAAEIALSEIRENEMRWQDSVDANIAALAIAVARHVIGHELKAEPTTVAELVKRALAEFPLDQPMRVRVNPLDLSVLSLHTTPSGEPISIAPNRDVYWLADARIQPGGCVVEGRDRIVDGRVDTALERIYRRVSDTNA